MKKMFVAFGIAVAILVSAFGVATAKANDAVINEEEEPAIVDVLDLLYDYVEDDVLISDYDRVEIDRVRYDITSGEIVDVSYSVYDRNDQLILVGCVRWNWLVACTN